MIAESQSAEKWLNEQLAKQDRQPKTKDAAVTCAEILKRKTVSHLSLAGLDAYEVLQELDAFCTPIMNRPKPKPKVEEKKDEKKDEKKEEKKEDKKEETPGSEKKENGPAPSSPATPEDANPMDLD